MDIFKEILEEIMNSYQNIEQFYINVLKNGPVGVKS